MKRVILIATAIGMMLFCMCAVAHAESFKGKCSEAPYSVTGEVEIEESGACKISHGITATGYIKIKATGAVTIEGTVDAGYGFGVTTSGNLEVTGDVATNTAGDGGNVWIKAEGEVATGSITTGGGAHAGSVQIKANQGGGSHLFTIGGSGNSNGVNGSINTSGTTAGATESIYVQDGITIENGTTSSTGGITLEAMSDLNVIQSASRSGAIVLQAQNGVLKLPSGHLSANGDTGEGAGFVQLMAKEISVESGAEITAIQEESAAATCHNVILAASTVKHGSSKLELRADGKGYEKACGGAVELVPQGAIAITYLGSNEVTYWEERTVGESSSNSLSLEGTGELVITADGKKDTVEIWGNPLKMHKTKIFAAGSENEVFIYSGTGWSSPTYNKLTFAEPVEVFASTEEKGATTNKIYVRGSEIAKPEGHVELDAAGLKGANGGTVQLVSEKGEVYLGESSSTITLNVSAFDGEGSGGTAKVEAGKSTVKIAEGNAFYASSSAGNSNAGTIEIFGGKIESTKANVALFATGHGSGKDGRIKLQSEGKLAIGGSSGELELVLAGEATGGAGTAELSGSEVEVNGGYIFDTPDTAGNGAEVKVYDTGTLKVSNEFELKANAGPDKGNGGVIDLKADDIEVTGPYTGTINANGTDNGKGGVITFESTNELQLKANLFARGSGSGEGGQIYVTTKSAKLELPLGYTVSANAGETDGTGKGGLIKVYTETSGNISIAATLEANGGSSAGDANKIEVVAANEVEVGSAGKIVANSTAGFAGAIDITAGMATETTLHMSGTVEASGEMSSSTAGVIELSAKEIDTEENGSIKAETPSGGVNAGGHIIFRNPNEYGGLLVTLATASATGNGAYISFMQPKGGTVDVLSSSITPGSWTGTIDASSAKEVLITYSGAENLVLGTIESPDKDAIASESSASLKGTSGTRIEAESVILETTSGSIGESTAQKLNTKTDELTAKTAFSKLGNVFVYNTKLGTATLKLLSTSIAGGEFEVETSGAMTISGLEAGSSINLIANEGLLEVEAKQKVTAVAGNVVLTNVASAGEIKLDKGSKIYASTTTTSTALGNIFIATNGRLTRDVPGLTPENVEPTVTGEDGHIYFNKGLLAEKPTNKVKAEDRIVAFDTNEESISHIKLGGEVELKAFGK